MQTAGVPEATHAPGLGERVTAYIALTKPRIIELLLVTTVPVMVVAQGGLPRAWLVLATVVGGAMAAGGANAMNMYVDRDIDARMQRTRNRPLVTGTIAPRDALAFAVSLEVIAFAWLWAFVNPLSAALAASACLFYVFIYTVWLKRTSKQNIVIGGAAGAVPVLIGWSSVANSVAWQPLLLFAVIFFWTPPHFWALAIKYREDYSAASVPMLPSVSTMRETGIQILAYSSIVVLLGVAFAPVAGMGVLYLCVAGVAGALFWWMSLDVLRKGTTQAAMRLFAFSITYLTVLFGAMAADVLVRHWA